MKHCVWQIQLESKGLQWKKNSVSVATSQQLTDSAMMRTNDFPFPLSSCLCKHLMQAKGAQIQHKKYAKQSQGRGSVRSTSHSGFDLVIFTLALAPWQQGKTGQWACTVSILNTKTAPLLRSCVTSIHHQLGKNRNTVYRLISWPEETTHALPIETWTIRWSPESKLTCKPKHKQAMWTDCKRVALQLWPGA